MAKDAKGHGSNGKSGTKFEVRQGKSKLTTPAKNIGEAKARGAQVGFRKPDAVVMKADAAADRKKAIAAYKAIKGGKHPGVSIGKKGK